MNAQPTARNRQRGFVAMAVTLLLGVAIAAILLGNLSARQHEFDNQARTAKALNEAKQAVLGYMLTDAPSSTPKPGRLPCPDHTNDNHSNLADNPGNNCGGVYLNRFPGRNFRTGEVRDAANEKLWYAIAPAIRDGLPTAVNLLTPTPLQIDGQGEYAAVIIAPGIALSGQSRGSDAARQDFLEDVNAVGGQQFTTKSAQPFNDKVIGVTRMEWERALVRAIAAETLKQLGKKLSAGTLPPPTPLTAYGTAVTDPLWWGDSRIPSGFLPVRALWAETDWPIKNEWHQLIYYALAPAFSVGGSGTCNDSSQCLTLMNNGSAVSGIKALIIVAGAPLPGQFRSSSSTVADYLEGAENTDGNNTYALPPAGTSNDWFFALR